MVFLGWVRNLSGGETKAKKRVFVFGCARVVPIYLFIYLSEFFYWEDACCWVGAGDEWMDGSEALGCHQRKEERWNYKFQK